MCVCVHLILHNVELNFKRKIKIVISLFYDDDGSFSNSGSKSQKKTKEQTKKNVQHKLDFDSIKIKSKQWIQSIFSVYNIYSCGVRTMLNQVGPPIQWDTTHDEDYAIWFEEYYAPNVVSISFKSCVTKLNSLVI